MKTLTTQSQKSLFAASLGLGFALALIAPSSIALGAPGPIKFMEILNGQSPEVPARTIYADGVRYDGRQNLFVGCADFDPTDEISAENTFMLYGNKDMQFDGMTVDPRIYESVNYHAKGSVGDRLCQKGRKVYINTSGMSPMVSTRIIPGHDEERNRYQDQWASLGFERFLNGGAGFRIKFQVQVNKQNGYVNNRPNIISQLPEYQPNSLAQEAALTWEGDFMVKNCETDTGDTVDVSQPQLKSVEEILKTQEEIMHPQFVRCNFVAKEMVSRDTPFWRAGHGEIFPRLKQVTLTVHPHYASLSYTVFKNAKSGGIQFKAERLRALRGKGNDSARLVESTQALMDVLNGVIPSLVINDRGARLPSTIAYLRQHRNEIQGYLADINQQLQDPNAPFDAIFNVTLSLNRAYQFLNQALGLTLPEPITINKAIEMASLKEAR